MKRHSLADAIALSDEKIGASAQEGLPLTRSQKAAARKAEKARLQHEEWLKIYEEQARKAAAEAAIQRAEDRQFWLSNREALLCLGRHAPVRSGRRTFSNTGCVAVLSALTIDGDKTRDEILRIMRHDYRYSYRHAGFMLSSLCGPDPDQHFWYTDAQRLYHLHKTRWLSTVEISPGVFVAPLS
jgi:hypothetical protein